MTLIGKHVVGYQGWFYTPADGADQGWGHWFRGAPFAYNANVDLWPDVAEYDDDELAATGMTLPDGSPARLFSSYNPKTVARHFRWMRDAGIDGAWLGRFVAGTNDATQVRLDKILDNVRRAAEATGRAWFIWYDVTGNDPPTKGLIADWLHFGDLGPAYLQHRGKPLVGLWGAGDTVLPGTQDAWQEVMTFFKTRATVLLGGPRVWQNDPIMTQADVISPWAVFAYLEENGADQYKRDVLIPDLALTQARGQDYLPMLWPGFSWRNIQQGGTLNAVPRNGGRFYWRQAYNAVTAGAQCLATAMFDEYDESTAMCKAAPMQADVPAQGQWLSLDADGEALSSDYYLRLAGAAGRLLRGEIWPTGEIPITREKHMKVIDGYVLEAGTKKPVVPAYIQLIAQSGTHVDARSNIKDGSGYFNIGFEDQAITFLVLADGYAMKTGFVGDPQDGVTFDGGRLVVEVTPSGTFRTLVSGFLRTRGVDFIDDKDRPWLFAGYTIHLLLVKMAKGEDITPLLDEAIGYGANTIVVIGCHLSPWKKDNGFFYDPSAAGHFERLAQLFDLCAARTLRVAYAVWADMQYATFDKQTVWRKSCEVMKGRWNVIARKGNESTQNGYSEDDFGYPDMGGVLCSQGSQGGEVNPHRPILDFGEFEIRRDMPKAMIDANLLELRYGFPGWPAVDKPLVSIEPAFFHDTPKDQWGDERWTDPKLALALGLNTAANCAGGAFGASDSLEGKPLQPRAAECARAYFRGMWRGFVR